MHASHCQDTPLVTTIINTHALNRGGRGVVSPLDEH
jgi:hypothetical protein